MKIMVGGAKDTVRAPLSNVISRERRWCEP